MNKTMKIKIAMGIVVLGFFLVTNGSYVKSQPIVEGTEGLYPGLEYALCQLYDAYLEGGTKGARRFARRHGIHMEGDSLQVVMESDPSGTDPQVQAASAAAVLAVEDLGGHVEARFRYMVQSMLPLEALVVLSENAAVDRIRLPLRPVQLATSEGVARTGADQWHSVPTYRGSGTSARVCVLDLGFRGYQDLLGTELPANTATASFRADKDLEAVTAHGTACAEVIHDMAPNASLLLVNYSTDVEHHQAVEWIIANGVDVISYSMGWLSAGAGDGTGPICDDVDKAHQAGIMWISAAGNSAEQHWQGKFTDRSGDGWHEFDKKSVEATDYYSFRVEKGTNFSVWLNWDDWGAWNGTAYVGSEGQDYDLYLYDRNFELLEKSNSKQTQGANPLEGISLRARYQGKYYIRIKNRNTKRDCSLELFFSNASNLEHIVPYGSLNVPADSPQAVAVGAVGVGNDGFHAYSSRGPTSDKRIKPDLCAPAGVSTETFGKFGYFGTSAAAAHVAGAIALLKEKTQYSNAQILAILKARARDLGPAGKDNLYGDGRLNLIK